MAMALALAPAVSHARQWGGSIGYASDNIYRGVSLSSGRPAWLLDLHYRSEGGWVSGLSATQERPEFQAAGAQLTAYLDRVWQIDDRWTGKLGVVHYESPWNTFSSVLRYNEINAAIAYASRWRASVAWSPDTPRVDSRGRVSRGRILTSELTYHQPIGGRLAADFGVGSSNPRDSDQDYVYGSVGLSYAFENVFVYSTLVRADVGQSTYSVRQNPRHRWVTSVVWTF